MDKDFEKWWQEHGQYCRAGGGNYEKTFAFRSWEAATKRAATKHAPKPRELKAVGTGALLGEQQYCFEKGWKEGIAAFRKMLRSNAKVSGAGTASAGLPGYAGDNNGERK